MPRPNHRTLPWQGLLALIAILLLIGCTVWGGSQAATPEQLALRMTPLKRGAQRSTVVKPAPGGTLVIYEDIVPQQNPDEFDIGYAYVVLEPFGWRVREGGNAAGRGTRPLWMFGHTPTPASSWSMVVGKVRDPSVSRITAVFSNGQAVQDVIVNGLFGAVVVPSGWLCQLDLWDAQERQFESYDYKGSGGNLFELVPVPPEPAQQACR